MSYLRDISSIAHNAKILNIIARTSLADMRDFLYQESLELSFSSFVYQKKSCCQAKKYGINLKTEEPIRQYFFTEELSTSKTA